MSADVLREAAALMRERAEAVREADPIPDWYTPNSLLDQWTGPEDAKHIASWHPAVALAVADWLDKQAEMSDSGNSIPAMRGRGYEHALAVARAYLGT